MGNELQGGTSHHFIAESRADEHQQQRGNAASLTRNGRLPISKQQSTIMKPSWQLARDASMDLLSKKTTKLSSTQGLTSNLPVNQRPIVKRYLFQPTLAPGKPLPTYRVPRIPSDKEIIEVAIAYQLLCEYCEGPCIGNYLRCRICIKTYHSHCLYERGHLNDPSFSLPRLGKQDWSCPECEDLTRLLSQEELNYLMSAFETMDQDKDGFITLDDYLKFCSTGKMRSGFNLFTQDNQDIEKLHFNLMDSRQKGVVPWSDFALFFSCKILASKNKTQLTTKLTKKELAFAKNLFFKDARLKTDNENNLIITKDYFNRVFNDLIQMTKKKYGANFVDVVLNDYQNVDDTIGGLTVVNWDEFLRQTSVPILLNRSNYDLKSSRPRRASIPLKLTQATVISHINLTSSSLDFKKNVTTTPTVTSSPDFSYDESFRKHGKILEKLNQRNQQEELRKKKFGALIDWSIVEDVGNEESFEVPKLKPNARDERQTISEPWTVVKDMEHLRTQPILLTTTRIQMIKV